MGLRAGFVCGETVEPEVRALLAATREVITAWCGGLCVVVLSPGGRSPARCCRTHNREPRERRHHE
jgi:hypothetical protein